MKVKELLKEEKKEGLYAAVRFSTETVDRIVKFASETGIPNLLKVEDFHSTLAYSRKPVTEFTPISQLNEIGIPSSFEIWESPPNAFKPEKTFCLVLKYDSDYMHKRFNEIMSMGATYDYDEYKPHLTFSYDVGPDFKVENLPPVKQLGKLNIVGEYSEVLDLDKTF